MILPTIVCTRSNWRIDLDNLIHFLRLRADSRTQFEMRALADVMCEITADWVSLAFAAFEDDRMGGANLSAKGVEALKRMLAGEEMDAEKAGMSAGEWRELMGVWGRQR